MSNGWMIGMMVVFVVLFLLLHVYIAKRFSKGFVTLFPRLHKWRGWIYGVFFLGAASIVASFFSVPYVLSVIGAYAMGIFVYLLLFFVIADVLIALAKLVRLIPKRVPNGVTIGVFGAVVVLTGSFVLYGSLHAMSIQEKAYTIITKDRVTSPDMKIVMVSDVHLGAVQSERRLEEMVQRINAQNPDVVTIVGDLFNDDFDSLRDVEAAKKAFQQIDSTYGVYAVLGNHDGGDTFDDMLAFMEESRIHVLKDEVTIIDDRLALAGRLDPSPIGGFGKLERQSIQHKLDELDDAMPVVVMDHTPNHLQEYGSDVDLILSGHTHKGQIFPGNYITSLVFDIDYGYGQLKKDAPQVVVSSGIGTWGMPMRVGSDSEIVIIELD